MDLALTPSQVELGAAARAAFAAGAGGGVVRAPIVVGPVTDLVVVARELGRAAVPSTFHTEVLARLLGWPEPVPAAVAVAIDLTPTPAGPAAATSTPRTGTPAGAGAPATYPTAGPAPATSPAADGLTGTGPATPPVASGAARAEPTAHPTASRSASGGGPATDPGADGPAGTGPATPPTAGGAAGTGPTAHPTASRPGLWGGPATDLGGAGGPAGTGPDTDSGAGGAAGTGPDAAPSPGDDVVTGVAEFVAHAADAAFLLVCVGANRVAEVDLRGPGIAITPQRTIGDDGRCRVTLSGAPIVRAWTCDVEAAVARAAVVLAADAVGAAEAALDAAVAHVRDRRQWGAPLGTLQAIQHRCADMLVDVTLAADAVLDAAGVADRGEPEPDIRLAASYAKATAVERCRRVTGSAHQLAGGQGILADRPFHRWYRRVKAAEPALGDLRHHRAAIAAALLDR